MPALGFERFRVVGEDRGAAVAVFADRLTCPVLTVGGRAYLGAEPGHQMTQVTKDVRSTAVESAGHNIPWRHPTSSPVPVSTVVTTALLVRASEAVPELKRHPLQLAKVLRE